MPRWSKLQRELYKIVDDTIDLQIHCSVQRIQTPQGCDEVSSYWITLGKETIWRYPDSKKNFHTIEFPEKFRVANYMSDISELIREYIDTPKDKLMTKVFIYDHWDLVDILRAADKRIGVRRLREFIKKIQSPAAIKIAERRLCNNQTI